MARSFLDIFLGRPETVQKSNGWDSIEKSLLDAESIEKASKGVRRAQHKYIRVFTGNNGKDRYLYPADMANPFKLLLSAFGIGKEKVEETYQANNIERAYGVDKNVFGAHLLEYLTNRVKWDTLFKNKAERDKNKEPVAQKVVEDNAAKKRAEKAKTVKDAAESAGSDNKKKMTVNRSLMRKIYSLYNPIPEDKADPAVEQKIEPTPVTPEVKPALEKIKEFVGRKTMKRPDGITVMTWPDGRIIHTDKKGGIVYDNYSLDTQSVVDTASEVPTVHRIEDTSNTQNVEETESELESHQNRSDAMLGNDNAKKYGLTDEDVSIVKRLVDKYNFTKEQFASSAARTGNIKAINDYAKEHGMKAYDVALDVYDIIINNKTEKKDGVTVEETASKLNDIKQFGNEVGIELSPDTITSIMSNLSEYTFGGLKGALKEYAEKVTPFTLSHIDESIEAWNERIAKEKLDFVNMYNRIKRDYLITIKNSKKDETAEESNEKPGYTEGEKAAIALAYRKEKDFDPTLSDYAYYEKIKAKFPELDAMGDLYRTMLNVKNLMLSDSQLDAAKEYLKSKGSVIEQAESSGEPVNNGQTFDDGYKVISEDETFKNQLINGTITIESLKEVHRQGVENGHESQAYADGVIQAAEDVMKEHGNKIAMLGNQNARKDGLTEEEKKIYDREYNWYKETYVDGIREQNPYTNEEETIADILKDEADERFTVYGENDIAYKALKDLYTDTTGKEYVPTKKNIAKPQTDSEMKEEKKKERKSREKAGLKVPDEEIGERSSAIEDVDIQNNEFTDTEESTKEELKNEVKTPSNQAQKDAFNELAAARLNLKKKEFGISFYGKGNHKLYATEEDVVEAQKRYDEALANYNKLIGGDSSDFSYNPNAENYAYRDTGYIAGSQKEKIAQFWADVAERGGGVNLEDIDWAALEENLRYAESKIVKSNIIKKPDFESLRESGMSGGAAYFYNRLLDCIPTKPAENTPEGHRNYVRAINTFQERMEKCQTVKDIVKEMTDIAGEMVGQLVGVENTPEVAAIQEQIEGLRDDMKAERNQFGHYEVELWKIPLVKEFAKNNNDFIKRAYGKPYPFALSGYVNSQDDKLASNFISFWTNNDKWYSFIKDNEKELMKYPEFKAYKSMLDKAVIIENSRYYQNRSVQLPIESQVKELEKQKKEIIDKKNIEYSLSSSEYKMWSAFGDKYNSRFAEYMRSAYSFDSFTYRGNKTILGHYDNARRGKFDDWEWLPKKEENSVSGTKKERKESFQLLVATEHERKGGKNVSVKTTQELKEMFNLRDIQSGEWVLNDPKSAKWHVDRCCEGFSDLCDITGIPENLVSLNGRLALAIGARGHKGALAHYEPVERVINITKMHGGGSLAHEWFHSFDNLLSEAMLGGNIDAWLTKPGKSHYRDAPDNIIPEVKQAFTNLVNAMKSGTIPVMKKVDITDTDRKNADKTLRSVLYYRNYSRANNVYGDVMKATSFDEANNILMNNFMPLTSYNGRFNSTKVRDFQKAQRAIAAKFNIDSANVFTGETASSFFIEARKLDGGKDGYWSSLHEMAARAFSGYIGDNLRNNGRVNTYLTSHDTNDSYVLYGVKPNPEGEERERINQAFKELFDVVKRTNAIQKSIDWETIENLTKSLTERKVRDDIERLQKSGKPVFVIKGDKFLIRK